MSDKCWIRFSNCIMNFLSCLIRYLLSYFKLWNCDAIFCNTVLDNISEIYAWCMFLLSCWILRQHTFINFIKLLTAMWLLKVTPFLTIPFTARWWTMLEIWWTAICTTFTWTCWKQEILLNNLNYSWRIHERNIEEEKKSSYL